MASPTSTVREAAVGEVPQLTVTLADAFATDGLGMARASRLQTFFERTHIREPHYYVRWIGVATRFQGQGLGTALLRPTLDRCDRDGMPAYLEASTERSAALYGRLGFVHLGELRVPDGPPFWAMRRPPAAK